MKGRGKLKVVGILFIIFGAIAGVFSLLGLAGSGMLMAFSETSLTTGVSSMLTVIMVILLVYAVFELIVGILGVKNCENSEKAGMLFGFGIVLVTVSVISGIITMVLTGFNVKNIISLLIGLILPVIFTYGAKQNQG